VRWVFVSVIPTGSKCLKKIKIKEPLVLGISKTSKNQEVL
jgi:hypothetical protein